MYTDVHCVLKNFPLSLCQTLTDVQNKVKCKEYNIPGLKFEKLGLIIFEKVSGDHFFDSPKYI